MGIFLIMVNVLLGFTQRIDAWPFACYPTFSGIDRPGIDSVSLDVVKIDGRVVPFESAVGSEKLRNAAYWGMIRKILASGPGEQRKERLRGLWLLVSGENPSLAADTRSVRFYRSTRSTVPEEWDQKAARKDFLDEIVV
jgi:hypothetical protein